MFLPLVATPGGTETPPPAAQKHKARTPTPKSGYPIQSFTHQRKVDKEVALKLSTQLLHKLPKEGKSDMYFDVWPMNNPSRKVLTAADELATTTSMSQKSKSYNPSGTAEDSSHKRKKVPQLVHEIEEMIEEGLNMLHYQYPNCVSHFVDNPPDASKDHHVGEGRLMDSRKRQRAFKSQKHDGLQHVLSMVPMDPGDEAGRILESLPPPLQEAGNQDVNEEFQYIFGRLQVFRRAAKHFATEFKSYEKLLSWMFSEYERYVQYYVKTVEVQKEKLLQDRKEFLHESTDVYRREKQCRAENEELLQKLNEKKKELGSVTGELQELKQRMIILESDANNIQKERETFEFEKSCSAKEMIKSDALVEDLERRLKDPEKKIADLREQLDNNKLLIERLKEFQQATVSENSSLKRQVTVLQQARSLTLPNRSVRKLESELGFALQREETLMDTVTKLQLQLNSTEEQYAELVDSCELQSKKDLDSGLMMTPRPHMGAEFVPQGPTTAARMLSAARSIEIDRKELSKKDELLAMLCSLQSVDIEDLRRLRILDKKQQQQEIVGDEKEKSVSHHASLMQRSKNMAPLFDISRIWFVGFGTSETVLPFLRFAGRIRNMRLTRDATRKYIQRFWAEMGPSSIPTSANTNILDSPETVADRFNTWILTRMGSEDEASAAYSLYHAFHWYSFDAQCRLFLDVLTGKVKEVVWHHTVEQIHLLQEFLEHRIQQLKVSRLTKVQAWSCIARFFSTWENEQIGKAFVALGADKPERAAVDLHQLFQVGANWSYSTFMHCIFEGIVADQEAFLRDFELAILDQRAIVSGLVTPSIAVYALELVDPARPIEMTIRFIKTYFGDNSVDLNYDASLNVKLEDQLLKCETGIDLPLFLSKVKKDVVRRYSRKKANGKITMAFDVTSIFEGTTHVDAESNTGGKQQGSPRPKPEA